MEKNFYRRLLWSYIWHFCRDCHYWPTEYVVEQTSVPGPEDLCYSWRLKQNWNTCDRALMAYRPTAWLKPK